MCKQKWQNHNPLHWYYGLLNGKLNIEPGRFSTVSTLDENQDCFDKQRNIFMFYKQARFLRNSFQPTHLYTIFPAVLSTSFPTWDRPAFRPYSRCVTLPALSFGNQRNLSSFLLKYACKVYEEVWRENLKLKPHLLDTSYLNQLPSFHRLEWEFILQT